MPRSLGRAPCGGLGPHPPTLMLYEPGEPGTANLRLLTQGLGIPMSSAQVQVWRTTRFFSRVLPNKQVIQEPYFAANLTPRRAHIPPAQIHTKAPRTPRRLLPRCSALCPSREKAGQARRGQARVGLTTTKLCSFHCAVVLLRGCLWYGPHDLRSRT